MGSRYGPGVGGAAPGLGGAEGPRGSGFGWCRGWALCRQVQGSPRFGGAVEPRVARFRGAVALGAPDLGDPGVSVPQVLGNDRAACLHAFPVPVSREAADLRVSGHPPPPEGTEIPISGGTCKSHANERGRVPARGTVTGDTGSPSLPFPGVPCPGIRLWVSCSTPALPPSPAGLGSPPEGSQFPFLWFLLESPNGRLSHPQVPPS